MSGSDRGSQGSRHDESPDAVQRDPARAVSTAQRRAPNVSADDTCRLIHIAGDPSLLGLITAAFAPLDREALDTPQDDRVDPWDGIAEAFNDYVRFGAYFNITTMKMPDETIKSAPRMETAFLVCGEWNPVDSERPPRDPSWIRRMLADLRTRFTRCRNNYHASGNQDAENDVDEFYNFCSGDPAVLYAYCVWGDEAQDFFDRRVAQEYQREEGIPEYIFFNDDKSDSASGDASLLATQSSTSSSRGTPARNSVKKRRRTPNSQLDTEAQMKRAAVEHQLMAQQIQSQASMQRWFDATATAQAKSTEIAGRNADIAQQRMHLEMLQRIVSDPNFPEELRQAAKEQLLMKISRDYQGITTVAQL